MKENKEDLVGVSQEDLDAIESVDLSDETLEKIYEDLTDEDLARMMPKNIPYKKIFNSEGKLANPITKKDPYRSTFLNRRDKKALIKKSTKHPKNNKKGVRLLVTPFAKGKFVKTKVVKQNIPANIVTIFGGDFLPTGHKYQKARTLIHNQIQL